MRHIVLFAALMSLLTTHARARGVEPPRIKEPPAIRFASLVVPAAKPSLNIDNDHTCDKCGAYSNIVAKQANGMHSHVCTNPTCRNEWWHSDPGTVQAQPTYTLPASGCANGNCASPTRTTQTRWRLR